MKLTTLIHPVDCKSNPRHVSVLPAAVLSYSLMPLGRGLGKVGLLFRLLNRTNPDDRWMSETASSR